LSTKTTNSGAEYYSIKALTVDKFGNYEIAEFEQLIIIISDLIDDVTENSITISIPFTPETLYNEFTVKVDGAVLLEDYDFVQDSATGETFVYIFDLTPSETYSIQILRDSEVGSWISNIIEVTTDDSAG
jgi:hypothetical protein